MADRLRRVGRLALGVLTIWPPLFLPVGGVVALGADPPAEWLKIAMVATVGLSLILVAAFIAHAFRNRRLSDDMQVFWIVALMVGSLLVTPFYWWNELRRPLTDRSARPG